MARVGGRAPDRGWGAAAKRALAELARADPGQGEDAAHRARIVAVLARFARRIAEARGLPGDLAEGAFALLVPQRGKRAEAVRARAEQITEPLLGPWTEGAVSDDLGAAYEAILIGRRGGGCHYTAPQLADALVERALAPLGAETAALRILDPAMGSGACLLAAHRWLVRNADRAAESRSATRADLAASLFGVDVDPLATAVARVALWLEVGDPTWPMAATDARLITADALATPWPSGLPRAFDAVIGNPPWVSYVGRAAQPLTAERRAHLEATFVAFAGYRNLQGLFAELSGRLLRPGGRLSLLLPSSMAEQQGYGPTREALARLCDVDAELPDVGEDAFAGVFQPCMILLATRRESAGGATDAAPWPVERPDLEEADRALLARLVALPTLPAATFGERGVQTSGELAEQLAPAADAQRTLSLRSGSDVAAFRRWPPSRWVDPSQLAARFRDGPWHEVAFVVRQTAAYPVAARSDGGAFRNSLLAGFGTPGFSADLVVAWLNASPVRWLHHTRFRDARQGMPQVKIGHLRAIPAPPTGPARDALEALGAALSTANAGIAEDQQDRLDALAADALGLDAADRARIAAWRRGHPPAARRARAAASPTIRSKGPAGKR